jgi:multisubunit Na+/H+ antiporter MnhB subunit
MLEIILLVLILLMIVGAIVAIETSNMLYSVISVGAVGFLLSIVFLFLSAPDLAITQISVEVITLVLLLKATRRSEGEPDSLHPVTGRKVAALLMVIVLAVFTTGMFTEFPEFGSSVMDRFHDAPSETYLSTGLEETGAANIVTAVLLDFRAYDTLGEATVLFCAVTGALIVLRQQAKKGLDEADQEQET